ncbi:tetratricopeptide repeat protein [Aquicoccus sp. SCR17]|nr:tetratricopeptide repeat protein [Carideicomes alvinocaridis]
MGTSVSKLKRTVATLFAIVMYSLPAAAESDRAAALLDELQMADPSRAGRIVEEIRQEWSKSGSASMDLLLKRGRDAMEAGDLQAAAEHLTALTDHAPDFAEGWASRALVFYRMEEFGMAMSDLEHALALNPHHFGAIQGVGAIFEQIDRPEPAYQAYSRALALNPHDTDVQAAMERLKPGVIGTEI